MIFMTWNAELAYDVTPKPFCPPRCLPNPSRRLFTRTGFFSPSLDGGLSLFELFNPSRRSSSAIRAFSDAFSALSAAISAIGSSRDGSLSVSRDHSILNRKPLPPSREIYRQSKSRSPTWAVTNFQRYQPELKSYGHDLMRLAEDACEEFTLKRLPPLVLKELEELSRWYSQHELRYGLLPSILINPTTIPNQLVSRRLMALLRLVERELVHERQTQ